MKRLLVLSLLFLGWTTGFSRAVPSVPPEENIAEPVIVLGLTNVLPKNSVRIGRFRSSDYAREGICGYDEWIDRLKQVAREQGANLVKITEHVAPSGRRTCHSIRADIYRTSDEAVFGIFDEHTDYFGDPAVDPELWRENCAVIHFYRPYSTAGNGLGFLIRSGDEELCFMRPGTTASVKVRAGEETELRAEANLIAVLSVELKPGYHYFVRCLLRENMFGIRPALELSEPRKGYRDFRNIKQDEDKRK